jgi:hypothetical protein
MTGHGVWGHRAGMKTLSLLALALLAGCHRPTEPRCIRKGDTLAKLIIAGTTRTDTIWLLSDKDSGCR